MKILIVCAMVEEVAPIRQHFKVETKDRVGHMTIEMGKYQEADMCVVESGIGKVNAAMGTSVGIERFQPDVILNYGVVGALADDLEPGDIVIPDDFCYHDADDTAFGSPLGQVPRMPHTYPIAEDLGPIQTSLLELGPNIKSGQCLSGDAFVHRPDQINFIKEHFPHAAIIEMEATAIAQVAYTYQLPFLAIKTISDSTDQEDSAQEYLESKDQVAVEAVDVLFESIDLLIKGEMS